MTAVGAMKQLLADLEAEIHAVWGSLEAEGHKDADRLRAVYERVRDLLHGAEAEVKADAEQVAEHAAGGLIPGPRTPA